MEYRIAGSHRTSHGGRVPNVAFNQLNVAGNLLEIRPFAGREVVEHSDVVPFLEQSAHNVRTDEPATTSNQHSHQPR